MHEIKQISKRHPALMGYFSPALRSYASRPYAPGRYPLRSGLGRRIGPSKQKKGSVVTLAAFRYIWSLVKFPAFYSSSHPGVITVICHLFAGVKPAIKCIGLKTGPIRHSPAQLSNRKAFVIADKGFIS